MAILISICTLDKFYALYALGLSKLIDECYRNRGSQICFSQSVVPILRDMASADGYIDPATCVSTAVPLIVFYEASENQNTSLELNSKRNIVEDPKPRGKE